MSTTTHLWAIGYDDIARADQVRDEITELGWGAGKASKYLILEDIAELSVTTFRTFVRGLSPPRTKTERLSSSCRSSSQRAP